MSYQPIIREIILGGRSYKYIFILFLCVAFVIPGGASGNIKCYSFNKSGSDSNPNWSIDYGSFGYDDDELHLTDNSKFHIYIDGPGTISFRWRCSSYSQLVYREYHNGKLHDEEECNAHNFDGEPVNHELENGTYKVEWEFITDLDNQFGYIDDLCIPRSYKAPSCEDVVYIDSNNVDSNNVDSNNVDSNNVDSNNVDSNNVDSNNVDSNNVDSNNVDSNNVDSNNVDSNNVDSNNVDSNVSHEAANGKKAITNVNSHVDEYDGTFNSIEKAIENVVDGGIVRIQSDIYVEKEIKINRSIHLIGDAQIKPIINSRSNNVICVEGASNVHVENISIIGGRKGVIFKGTTSSALLNNDINCIEEGVLLLDSNKCIIQGNTIKCKGPDTCALKSMCANSNEIFNNNLSDIDIGICFISSNGCKIMGNIIDADVSGIILEQGEDTEICANRIQTNGRELQSREDEKGIVLSNTINSNIDKNNISGFEIGLADTESQEIEIKNNNINSIYVIGIDLDGTGNFNIYGNDISANSNPNYGIADYGIYVANIDSQEGVVRVLKNNIFNNLYCGVCFVNIYGDIYHSNNTLQFSNRRILRGCPIQIESCDINNIIPNNCIDEDCIVQRDN